MTDKLPELLAPAGSFEALQAAIEAGADAVYFGGEAFGARAFAKNFTREEIAEAAKLCRAYSVKSYVTLNTLILDREMKDVLEYTTFLEDAGVDALIIADMGAASLIRKHIPSMPLHASTQFSGHNADAAKFLCEHGFTRMVGARELSCENLNALCAASPIEIEMFIHGALCVCHSGQCLLSCMAGGRSGNRGMCAQPCRLPDSKGNYPLSLKDLSLSNHIPEILKSGVASLKIEGRMKSPEYVYGVTRIYRRLLTERRNATHSETEELAAIFSRGGFTDGYFTHQISSAMLGTRSEEERKISRALQPFGGLCRRVPLSMRAVFRANLPFALTLSGARGEVTVYGDTPESAVNAPIDKSALEKNLTKFGGTPYELTNLEIDMEDGLILRISEINALRRKAIAAYASLGERTHLHTGTYTPAVTARTDKNKKTALVMRAKNLPMEQRFFDYFDIVFLPLYEFLLANDSRVKGVLLPAVITDKEREKVLFDLTRAVQMGATEALVGNYGHIETARRAGLNLHGDLRLNITNRSAADFAFDSGFETLILSPELTAAQLRDIGGSCRAVVYGRLPVMLLEKCVAKEVSDCKTCAQDGAVLRDRRGARFPILREEPHRNILFNSVPTYAADRLPRGGQHYLFTTESAAQILQVLNAYENKLPPKGDIRRIREK